MNSIDDIYDLEPDTQRAPRVTTDLPLQPLIPPLTDATEDFNRAVRNLWDASLELMWTDRLELSERRDAVDRAAHAVMVMQSVMAVTK